MAHADGLRTVCKGDLILVVLAMRSGGENTERNAGRKAKASCVGCDDSVKSQESNKTKPEQPPLEFILVWFGLVWFGLVWFGLIRSGLV